MAKRMWRSSQPPVSTEGRRGYFDLAYGTESEKQKPSMLAGLKKGYAVAGAGDYPGSAPFFGLTGNC